jgi:hypothetical protein
VRRGPSRWTVRLVFPRRFGGNRVYVDDALQAAECEVHALTVQSWSFPLAVRDGGDIVCSLVVHGSFRIRGFRLILAGATVYGDGTLTLR